MELVQEQVEEIYHEILRKRIKERALYLLKAADKTEYEIRTKLRQAFYPEELIDYAVDFLKQYRYIDDHSNMKATLPDVPSAPPHLLKYMRMLATVRLVLSVAVSTRKAMP